MVSRYFPSVRASTGFVGSTIKFRRKGEYILKGRRIIPIEEVSRLWMLGLSVRNICLAIGSVRGTKFTVQAVEVMINRERRRGNIEMFPFRQSGDDGEEDHGINEETAFRLGL